MCSVSSKHTLYCTTVFEWEPWVKALLFNSTRKKNASHHESVVLHGHYWRPLHYRGHIEASRLLGIHSKSAPSLNKEDLGMTGPKALFTGLIAYKHDGHFFCGCFNFLPPPPVKKSQEAPWLKNVVSKPHIFKLHDAVKISLSIFLPTGSSHYNPVLPPIRM